jgi:hypothetical protein
MARFVFSGVAALLFTAIFAACTPANNGGTGLLPATHQVTPKDSGGGLPPHPAPTP